MKTTRKFTLLSLCLSFFCLTSVSLFGNTEDPLSLPPPPPPTVDVMVCESIASINVVFLEAVNNAILEVNSEEGQAMYQAAGEANANDELTIDTRTWKKGRYALRVRAQGRADKLMYLNVQ